MVEEIKSEIADHPLIWVFKLLSEKPELLTSIIIGILLHQSLRFVIPVLIGDLVEFGIEDNNPGKVKYYAMLMLISLINRSSIANLI